jgi:hypothetical protein
MGVLPDVYLTGYLNNIMSESSAPEPLASQREFGSVTIALRGYGPKTPRVAGEALLARVTTRTIPVNPATSETPGGFGAWLYSNQLIDPPGTYYTVSTADDNGDVVQTDAYFLETGQWDISDMQPYDPGQPPPPLPPLIIPQLLIIPPSATPDFDGTNFTAFQLTLNQDAQATAENMVAGNLYTFIILQAATAYNFTWPANAYNGSPISMQPNSYTIQTFVAIEGGVLYAIGGASWYTL